MQLYIVTLAIIGAMIFAAIEQDNGRIKAPSEISQFFKVLKG